jgi:hypothetical protein
MAVGHRLYDRTSGWTESLRYRAPLAVLPPDSKDWVAEAKAVYESTVVRMLLDGVI